MQFSFVVVAILVASSAVFGQICPCNDNPPAAAEGEIQYTCAEQKAFNQCDADFMLGFCECTCGRCCPCNDFPPIDDKFTCKQQKDFGKCDDGFMVGFCECECGRCPALNATTNVIEGSVFERPSTLPVAPPVITPPKETVVVVSANGCSKGLIPIFGSSDCESASCAKNRQRCANNCGGLLQIKFDCKDVVKQGSRAFSSSCACTGKK